MRRFIFYSVVLLGLAIAALIHYGCGYSNYLSLTQHNELEKIVVQIHSTGIDEDGKIWDRTTIGFRIRNGYVIGLTHATRASFQDCAVTPFGVLCNEVETTNRKYEINGEEVELVGSYEDITLFKTDADAPYIPFGDSSKLIRGTRIAAWGFSFAKAHNFKTGVVSIPLVRNEYKESTKNLSVDVPGRVMLIDMSVNNGDSGSPVVAEYNGELRLVGIICAVTPMAQGINFAFTSNYVKKAIKEIR